MVTDDVSKIKILRAELQRKPRVRSSAQRTPTIKLPLELTPR